MGPRSYVTGRILIRDQVCTEEILYMARPRGCKHNHMMHRYFDWFTLINILVA